MDRSFLRGVVTDFRGALGELVAQGYFFQISISQDFPAGCCDDSSLLLAAYLTDMGIPGALRIQGGGGGMHKELGSHVWLKVGPYLIDITGSQFEGYRQPEILISESDSLLATFDVSEEPEIADFRMKFSNDPRILWQFSEAYEAVTDLLKRQCPAS